MIARADALRLPLPDKSVDLVIGSPPYLEQRTYGLGKSAKRKLEPWIEWMLQVTREAVRVSRGLVIWVCAGATKKWQYQPGPEGLLYRWVAAGGIAWRPCYWQRVGIPGSGMAQWYRADIEYILAFTANRGQVPFGNPKRNGHKPKWAPGGEMSYRLQNGSRRSRSVWGGDAGTAMNRDSNGFRKTPSKSMKAERFRHDANGNFLFDYAKDFLVKGGHDRDIVAIANPGNVLKCKVGGGLMGHKTAHENEAPYPVGVPAFFVRSHCPVGGLVLDPFGGSGTTAHAALNEGRRYVSFDLRQNQCEITRKRLATVTPSLPFGEST